MTWDFDWVYASTNPKNRPPWLKKKKVKGQTVKGKGKSKKKGC